MIQGDTNYNDTRLREDFPEVARAFESVLLTNKELSGKLKYLYYSDYKTASRPRKKISLQRILREIEAAGYKIEIKVHGKITEISASPPQ